MLSKPTESALNLQVVEEAYSSNLYLAMASWCEVQALQGSAKFLYHHADEERTHQMKLFKYINDTGGHALVPALQAPPSEFKSLQEVFTSALEHEIHITQCINKLVAASLEEKDFGTFNFLQWFVAEQLEEEKLFRAVVDLIRLAGLDGRGLILVDKEIGKMVAS